jgi:hypothetical protein
VHALLKLKNAIDRNAMIITFRHVGRCILEIPFDQIHAGYAVRFVAACKHVDKNSLLCGFAEADIDGIHISNP